MSPISDAAMYHLVGSPVTTANSQIEVTPCRANRVRTSIARVTMNHPIVQHPARRLLPGPCACAPRSPEPEEASTAGSSCDVSSRRRHCGEAYLSVWSTDVYFLVWSICQHSTTHSAQCARARDAPPQRQNLGGPVTTANLKKMT